MRQFYLGCDLPNRVACPASGENGGKLATSAPVSFRPGVKQAAILFDDQDCADQ